MSDTPFSSVHIAALERSYLDASPEVESTTVGAVHVEPDHWQRIVSVAKSDDRRHPAFDSSHLLAGCAVVAPCDHVFFGIIGTGPTTEVLFSIMDPAGRAIDTEDLVSVLTANIPGATLDAEPHVATGGMRQKGIGAKLAALSHTAAIVGTPGIPRVRESRVAPVDLLISGLRDSSPSNRWAFMVVARRLPNSDVSPRISSVLSTLRIVADAQKGSQPAAEYYVELLKRVLNKLKNGKSSGLWTVSTQILASSEALLSRARGLALSAFSGSESHLDPIRSVLLTGPETLAAPLRFDAPPAPTPGPQVWTGAYSSLLSSKELAIFISMPQLERPGYDTRVAPHFGQALRVGTGQTIEIGDILDRGVTTGSKYALPIGDLNSHGLVAGITGSGKTNTLFNILREIYGAKVPFLVVEPTKTEYRDLMEDKELGGNLRVYTLGLETVAPFRLNPFEVPKGVTVQTHLDRLKAVFNASFSMFSPMPQVLERSLNEIYEDFGWSLTTNENRRGQDVDTFPTLSDLYANVDKVVKSLGYEERITSDVSAALKTRIDSLCIGAKGHMLDTRVSCDFGELLGINRAQTEKPLGTILELDALGDDDEKAFVVGLIFLRIAEAQALAGPSYGTLRHLTVVEEAHRLFQNVPLVAGSEVGNPRGKAVETFCNMLSEIRAFGEGVLIVDQIPVRLAPDAIKNTNLKIMHRLPSEDDRDVLGHAMGLSPTQIKMASALALGSAIIYSGGQDESFEVGIGKFTREKLTVEQKTRSDKLVAERMASISASSRNRFETGTPSTRRLRALENDSEFREQLTRFLLSRALTPGEHRDVLVPLLQQVARHNTGESRETAVLLLRTSLRRALERIGLSAAWSFDLLHKIEAAFLVAFDKALQGLLEGRKPEPGGMNDSVVALWDEQSKVLIYPFPQCPAVCPNFECRHRWGAADLALNSTLTKSWNEAVSSSADSKLWNRITKVVDRAVERGLAQAVGDEYRRQFGMCFMIQRAHLDESLETTMRARISQNVMKELEKRSAEVAAKNATA